MESDDFKATVVTNPVSYVLEDDFSEQHKVDVNFRKALKKACEKYENEPKKTISVVFQLKEDLGSFAAVDGQCIKTEFEGRKRLAIFDCLDGPAPDPDEKTSSVNIVLAAVKAAFEVTGALEKVFDERCFKTDDEQCLYEDKISVSARVHLVSPLSPADLAAKSEASKKLIKKIAIGITTGKTNLRQPVVNDFGILLEELVEALQLDPSPDSAYLRLWYLQLWDRVNRIRRSFGRRRPKILNDANLEDERSHRNEIAHRGVDTVDGAMLKSLQTKAFRFIRKNL